MNNEKFAKEIVETIRAIDEKQYKLGEFLGNDINFLGNETRKLENLFYEILGINEDQIERLGDCFYFLLAEEEFEGDKYTFENFIADVNNVKNGEDLRPYLTSGHYYE